MKKNIHVPFQRSHSGKGEIFSHKKIITTATLIAGLTACGGGGEGPGSTPTGNTTPTIPPVTTPVNTIPTSSTSMIEFGPIAGGTVEFQTLSGGILSSGSTKNDGSLDYNPRDIVSKMGNDQWLIVQVSGGQDTDVDDDGIRDAVPTPLRGSFRMLVPRSALESGERIVVNPRSGAISELLLAKNSIITTELLDVVARQSGANDQNNDGVIDYRDTYSLQMKDVTGVSRLVPATSGYIASIHSGSPAQKTTALSNIARTENHIIARIVPSANTDDHMPSLELTTSSPGAQILYTLDLSSPIPGGNSTRSATSKLVVPFQSAKLYYHEYSQVGGQMVLGKVVGFDLSSDWTELAQTSVPYNSAGKENLIIESFSYKNTPYTITSIANSVSSGYTYPKTISCQVGSNKDAGCHYGPYMVWSPEHESRVRALIGTAVQTYIDTPVVVVPVTPIGLIDTIRSNIPYNGATYSIKNTWTTGANNTKIFPVVIDIILNRKNGQIYTISRTVNTQGDLTSYNTQLEQSIRDYIDSDNTVSPTPTHSRNESVSYTTRVSNYYGGFYEVFNIYNLDGKSDFPVQISGIYGVQNQGTKTPATMIATNETERVQKSNQMIVDIQGIIQAGYIHTPPTFSKNQLIDSGFISYRGYGYNILTTMNITGTSDYPASVRVSYTTPLSSNNTTQTINANSATELSNVQAERANDAKARIDLIVNADQYAPNAVETITNTTSYGGGSYYTKFTYSGNPGQDYPGYIDVYVTYRNGSSDKITITADNANQKTTYASNLEGQAKLQIDNYNPTFPVDLIGSDGPYAYGNKGSEYTYKVKYNRVGNGANYPALVWIEYKSRSTGQILDTRNTYGNTIANSSVERDQIKATLTNFVKGQMVAMNPQSQDMMLVTNWKITDLLPISSAHAQTAPSSILVNKTNTQFQKFSPLNSNTTYGKFFGNNGTVFEHFVRNEAGKGGMGGLSQAEIEKKINDRITDIMDKYATDGTLYLGDLPDSAMPIMTAIFTDVINKKTADEIYAKYKQQLTALGVTVETMTKMHGKILIVASEGLNGTQEVYPENYVFGAKALFGLGKIGINMIVNKSTGKILAQSIVGQGGVEFMKYESRVLSGKVVFSDATGKVIRLEQGLVGKWGFNYIFKTVKDSNFMRVEDMMRALVNTSGVSKVLGKTTIESFDDFEKIIAYTIKNGTYKITENSKAEYILDFGGKLLKVIVDRTDGRLLNISF